MAEENGGQEVFGRIFVRELVRAQYRGLSSSYRWYAMTRCLQAKVSKGTTIRVLPDSQILFVPVDSYCTHGRLIFDTLPFAVIK